MQTMQPVYRKEPVKRVYDCQNFGITLLLVAWGGGLVYLLVYDQILGRDIVYMLPQSVVENFRYPSIIVHPNITQIWLEQLTNYTRN